MAGCMIRMAKRELLASIQDRCQGTSKKDNYRILVDFMAVTGHHRKRGIRSLAQPGDWGVRTGSLTYIGALFRTAQPEEEVPPGKMAITSTYS